MQHVVRKDPVVIISGWGFGRGFLEDQLAWMKTSRDLSCVSLEELLNSTSELGREHSARERLISGLESQLSGEGSTILIGWSLGAILALEFATLFPKRISGLLLFCGTPSFCQREGFPCGTSRSEMSAFRKGFRMTPEPVLRAFRERVCDIAHEGLCYTHHNSGFRLSENIFGSYLKVTQSQRPNMTPICFQRKRNSELRWVYEEETSQGLSDELASSLLCGLSYLEHVDLRDGLKSCDLPLMLVHAQDDAVVPVEASRYIEQSVSNCRTLFLPRGGHTPFLNLSDLEKKEIEEFLDNV